MKTGVRRWIRDKGGVTSSELSAIVDKLADPASKTGLPEVRHIARPSGATFAVSGSWNDESAFMLTNPQSVDTTDRSLVDRAPTRTIPIVFGDMNTGIGLEPDGDSFRCSDGGLGRGGRSGCAPR